MSSRVQKLIGLFGLEPHPEGGYYKEIYRSDEKVQTGDQRSARDALTSIYFLLNSGQHSKFHMVLSDEVWHFLEGDPLELVLCSPDFSEVKRVKLGVAGTDRHPCVVVPAGWWQAARPLGSYTLCGCTVAPGFVFEDFSMLDQDLDKTGVLLERQPELAPFL